MRVDFKGEGYQDGFENREPLFLVFDTPYQQREYEEGFEAGQRDREEVQRDCSSNT